MCTDSNQSINSIMFKAVSILIRGVGIRFFVRGIFGAFYGSRISPRGSDRVMMTRPDPTRPDPTRPDPTRPDP